MSDAAAECVETTHKCIQCKKDKCESNFRVYRGERREVCLSCEAKNTREVQTRKLRKEYGEQVAHLTGDLKHCRACDGVFEIKSFRKDKSKDGHFSKCMCCEEENKPLMNKAQLVAFRAANSKAASDIAEEVAGDTEKLVDVRREGDSLVTEFETVKGDEGVAEVINSASDGKALVEEAKEIAEDAKEVVEEARGWFARVKAWWRRTF